MKDDHITCLSYSCLLGNNSLPARKQCIVVGRNTPKLGVGDTVNIDFDTILVTFSSIPLFRYYFDTDTGISYYEI